MFRLGTSNNMISKLHKRSLRIILNDHSKDFKEFFKNNDDICHHHRIIQALLIEVFKIKTNSLLQQWSQFQTKESILKSFLSLHDFVSDRKRTVWFCLSYRYPQFQSLLPESVTEINSLSQFKRNIRQ